VYCLLSLSFLYEAIWRYFLFFPQPGRSPIIHAAHSLVSEIRKRDKIPWKLPCARQRFRALCLVPRTFGYSQVRCCRGRPCAWNTLARQRVTVYTVTAVVAENVISSYSRFPLLLFYIYFFSSLSPPPQSFAVMCAHCDDDDGPDAFVTQWHMRGFVCVCVCVCVCERLRFDKK
jgi:hypothetical protein